MSESVCISYVSHISFGAVHNSLCVLHERLSYGDVHTLVGMYNVRYLVRDIDIYLCMCPDSIEDNTLTVTA